MTKAFIQSLTLSLTVTLAALLAPTTAALAQDAAKGEQKAAMCIGCHGIPGYQASFPEVHRVPKISGQNGKYIAAALTAYRKGDRKHPSMRAVAISLSDADIADLAAYYEKHGAGSFAPVSDTAAVAPPSKAVDELITKGVCASCHGKNFNKPIDGAYPKIAGQPADYLYVALKAYQVEGNPHVGRANAIMAGQVKQFKLAELKAMAGYIASLPGDMHTVPQSKFR
jgi:cytochrome c553